MRFHVSITGAAEARRDLLELGRRFKGSKRPVLEKIADRLAQRIVRNIDAGDVAPPSEATLRIRATRRKRKAASNGTRPLVDTGQMRSRVRSIVTDTSAQALADTFYAGFVQLGIRATSPSSAVPNKSIPARPFQVLHQQDVDWALELIADYMDGSFSAAA